MNVKSLQISEKVSTIKIDAPTWLEQEKVKTLYILAGGYNQIGRNKNLEKYTELKKRFDAIISEAGSL